MNPTNKGKAEAALRTLESLGFEVKPLWVVLEERCAEYERGFPSEVDRMYTVPREAPKISQHFAEGGEPPELEAHLAWVGYHYVLTAGQREWLRDNTQMIPCRTVTVKSIELWPGTQHPRTMRLSSDVHIDPRLKKFTSGEVVVQAGKFFTEARALENESAQPDAKALERTTLVIGGYYRLDKLQRWAVMDLTKVKVMRRVQCTFVGPQEMRLEEEGGTVVTLGKEEFFQAVEEYRKQYPTLWKELQARREKGPYSGPRQKPQGKQYQSVEDLLKDLDEGKVNLEIK